MAICSSSHQCCSIRYQTINSDFFRYTCKLVNFATNKIVTYLSLIPLPLTFTLWFNRISTMSKNPNSDAKINAVLKWQWYIVLFLYITIPWTYSSFCFELTSTSEIVKNFSTVSKSPFSTALNNFLEQSTSSPWKKFLIRRKNDIQSISKTLTVNLRADFRAP